ncbi:MAG: SDR family oxidoreductase [Planctomycetota bacterium]|nr:SDR family oxidoreductase [Planctomycetota bacterium]
MLSLKEHSALVTGSSQGIGLAIADALATSGAKVCLHGLAFDDLAQRAVEQVRRQGARPVDLVDGDLVTEGTEGVESVFRKAIEKNPEIDLLVNNAGTYIDQPFLEMDFATFDQTMRLNVYSYFFLTQCFARYWVENGIQGRVLMVGSINGRLAEPDHAAYDTSKGAVEMMVRTLCVSLAPHGIRVNGIAPGLFRTPLTDGALQDPALMAWMKLHTPNGQVPGPEVCGEAAVYLLSNEAWHVNGQMLLVDGGMSSWQQPDPPVTS